MDGIIIINKSKGCTSHDVVYKVKKLLKEKVGHTGTLDPNATGVLPLLVGKGTGLSQYLINHNKKYVATIKLGEKTDTADVEGKIIEECVVDDSIFDSEKINKVLKKMIGKQKQCPPMYSAIKINGKKLYEYARSGKVVDIPEREIEIYDLQLVNFDSINKLIMFEVFCSKGTYIRTVCEQFAGNLGTVGYMKELNRTMVGEFKIEDSVTIEELEDNISNKKFFDEHFISIEQFFINNAKLNLDKTRLNLFLNGVKLDCDIIDTLVRIYDENDAFIGIGSVNSRKLKRNIII
nr:tRNA pseudouridine(55) synthase TruB [Clostridia bacterium]